MSRQSNFQGPTMANQDRSQSKGEDEKGMWSSMLDSVAKGKKLPEKNLIVLGGSPETQKELLDVLASDSPKRPQDRHRRKPVIANEFALGYTYQDVLDADHEDVLARLSSDKIDALELEQGWKEEEFDFVLQFLRTILMKPLKHNVIDRDKILVPPNWDSWGKIRVLREGFDVEGTSSGWSVDIQGPLQATSVSQEESGEADAAVSDQAPSEATSESAVLATYESTILKPRNLNDSNPLHSTPTIEVSTKSTQEFLAAQLETINSLQAEDERVAAASKTPGSTSFSTRSHDERVNEHIGPVQVNMGGIQVDADDMLKKLKNREREDVSEQPLDPASVAASKSPDEQKAENEKLSSFFAGLMKRGTSGSPRGTPGKDIKSSGGRETPTKKV
ncbi:dynein cytoplasmic 1 light intermediate chain, partial [Lecanoromycetidae sp. Uapishka_2]